MSQDTLRELSALCAQLRDAENECEELSAKLKAREAQARRLVEDDIPSLMAELGVQKLVLGTGETITVALEVYAQIPKDSKERAFAWLEENGHGGLIKTEVSVAFGREELNEAKRLAMEIAERGRQVLLDRNVHAGTLKAFLKEQLAAGAPVPLEIFGARSVNMAKIKEARA